MEVGTDEFTAVVFSSPQGGPPLLAADHNASSLHFAMYFVRISGKQWQACLRPPEILEEHAQVQFRYDLLDCHVDICAPEVLMLFSDNFDYQDIRKDFIHNECQNVEMGNKIFGKCNCFCFF